MEHLLGPDARDIPITAMAHRFCTTKTHQTFETRESRVSTISHRLPLLLTFHSWRSYRPLPARLRSRIKFQTQLYPIFQIIIHINPSRIDQKKTLQDLPGKVHVAYAWFLEGRFHEFRIDANHEGLLHDADGHLVVHHVTQSAHHFLCFKADFL